MRVLKDNEDKFFATRDHLASKIEEKGLFVPFIIAYYAGTTIVCKACRDLLIGENLQLCQMTESELKDRGIDPIVRANVVRNLLKRRNFL